MKLLKRKIIFSLASEIDFFKLNEGFSYYSYSFLYGRLINFRHSSIRDAILQLVKTGEVDKIVRNNFSFFRLTARGRERLLSFFPMSLGQKKVWDKIWRLVIFPTQPRFTQPRGCPFVDNLRRLRRTVRQLGFKKLSRGVYLTPLPVSAKLRELLLEKDFSANIAVIESRRLILGDDKQLAKQIWPLDDLLKKYQNLINRMRVLLRRLKKQKRLTQEGKKQFLLIFNFFFTLLEKDPGLPRKLLASDWPADFAKELFFKLSRRFKNEQEIK
jgi:DNA-binding transcriptional regulator PaaX